MTRVSTGAIRTLILSPLLLCFICFLVDLNRKPILFREDLLVESTHEESVYQKEEHQEQNHVEVAVVPPTGLYLDDEQGNQIKIAFTTTTANSVDDIKLWVRYHQSIGISLFYIFAEGQADYPFVKKELERFSSIKVFLNDEKLKQRRAHSQSWNETWLSAFFNKPCNHELFVRQSLNMEVAIHQARLDEVEWLIHIDLDELMYPTGSPSFNLQQYFETLPWNVDTVVFPNYEGLAERDDVNDPFTQVNLFKKNFAHVAADTFFRNYKTVAKGNPNYFTTYGNGKSAVRVQPKIRSNGAHRWYIYGRRPKEITAQQAAVLHYVYNRYQDLKERRDRCECAPTQEDVKRCFILPFDQAAFLASSLKDEAELHQYFLDHLVWENTEEVIKLIKEGLFVRLYEPQILMRMFKQLPDSGLVLATTEESKATVMDQYFP